MDTWLAGWDTQLEILGHVAVAVVLGGLVGIEREVRQRPAGFRTHMLVAGAAALFVGLADVLVGQFTFETYGGMLRTDPIRIVEAVVTGVSFLGAGTIFRRAENGIEGLTTAASLLLAAAIGVAVALGQLVLAVGVTVLTLLVLRLMHRLETAVRGAAE